jgi:hypothetical protein
MNSQVDKQERLPHNIDGCMTMMWLTKQREFG